MTRTPQMEVQTLLAEKATETNWLVQASCPTGCDLHVPGGWFTHLELSEDLSAEEALQVLEHEAADFRDDVAWRLVRENISTSLQQVAIAEIRPRELETSINKE